MPISLDPSSAAADSVSGFRLGSWRVDPDRNVISGAGNEKHLENRLMQTLLFLCKRQGQVIRREEFLQAVWHGRVVNDEALSRAISLLRTALEDNSARPAYIKTVPGVGYTLIAAVETDVEPNSHESVSGEPEESSIAVLPFVNLSNDPGKEFLSDGISEEIINALVQIPDFKVVGRTSCFAFKGVNDDLRKVARALGVSHVLEGSLRSSGDLIRVTAQLIKAEDGFHLFSKNFQCELQDVFAVQDEIAAGVAVELQRYLGDGAGKARETSAEAYAMYLQGVHFMRSAKADEMPKARKLFLAVTELDPEYAQAWVGLADCYWYMTSYGLWPRAEAVVLAGAACDRAIALDETLAEAHTCRANLCVAFSRDWDRAGKAIERALQLAPGHSGAALYAGNLARHLGDFEQAVEHLTQAITLDPLNLTGHIWLAYSYVALDMSDEACAIMHKALELNPQRVVLNWVLADILLWQGHYEAAYEQVLLEPDGFWRDFGEMMCLHFLQRNEEADAALAAILASEYEEAPFQMAEIYCVRGDHDRAFYWLDRAVELNDNGLVQIIGSTWLRPLRDDPRWVGVMADLNIPWEG